MHKWLKRIVLALAISAGAAVPSGAGELLSTHPSHYANPGATLQGGGSAIRGRTKQARPGSHVIVRDDGALVERWRLSPEFSRACNRRLFRQKRDQYLVAVVGGRTYGAAVGGHSSLIDRAKMAQNQIVYLFRGQGTTDCRVYHRTK